MRNVCSVDSFHRYKGRSPALLFSMIPGAEYCRSLVPDSIACGGIACIEVADPRAQHFDSQCRAAGPCCARAVPCSEAMLRRCITSPRWWFFPCSQQLVQVHNAQDQDLQHNRIFRDIQLAYAIQRSASAGKSRPFVVDALMDQPTWLVIPCFTMHSATTT